MDEPVGRLLSQGSQGVIRSSPLREDFDRLQYASREILILDPLSCWKGLAEEQRRWTGTERLRMQTEGR
jgi:hypothetical protein